MDEGKQQCTNCKCWRLLHDFIGSKNIPVKRCSKCREKDARQKQKPHIVQKRNERQRINKYWITYRENKRKEDEIVFLSHNAKIMKEWRDKNKKHLASWKRQNINYMLKAMKDSAFKKDLEWNLIDPENLMTSPCVYCGILPKDRVNGIDRMDSSLGYVQSNCVPCCKTCNLMKMCLDPTTFVERCRHIAGVEEHEDAWIDRVISTSFINYRYRARIKNIDFELSEDDFRKITAMPCAYCCKKTVDGKHSNGIDRADNTMGYTAVNCVPCCTECNYMKKTSTPSEFRAACAAVARNAPKIPDASIARQKSCIAPRKNKIVL